MIGLMLYVALIRDPTSL